MVPSSTSSANIFSQVKLLIQSHSALLLAKNKNKKIINIKSKHGLLKFLVSIILKTKYKLKGNKN